MIFVYIGALVAEVIGLALAAHGFRRTWLEFRNEGDEFLAPMVRPVRRRVLIMYARVRRSIGRPIPPVTGTINATLPMLVSAGAHGRVNWATLPRVDEDPTAFMDLLDRRLDELNDRTYEAEKHLRAQAGEAEVLRADAMAAIGKIRDEARGQVRTITVGGLREQVAGWVLIVAGVLAAGIADIIGAA